VQQGYFAGWLFTPAARRDFVRRYMASMPLVSAVELTLLEHGGAAAVVGKDITVEVLAWIRTLGLRPLGAIEQGLRSEPTRPLAGCDLTAQAASPDSLLQCGCSVHLNRGCGGHAVFHEAWYMHSAAMAEILCTQTVLRESC